MATALQHEFNLLIANMTKVCGALMKEGQIMPEDEQMKKALDDKYPTYHALIELRKSEAVQGNTDSLIAVTRTIILFLADVSAKRMTAIVDERKKFIDDVNTHVADHHNEKHREPHTAYILYSDGEICYTKGGDLYGARTFHQESPPICGSSLFKFPLRHDSELTYANMTLDECIRTRKMMIKIVQ